MILLKPKL